MAVEREFTGHLAGSNPHVRIEYRIRHKDGQYRWMLCRGLVATEPGADVRMAGSQTDITDRKMAEAQLKHDAFHDALTGLPNRALLAERIHRCLVRQARQPEFRFAVLYVDVDHFKVVNDSLGLVVGDAFLCALSRRLSSSIREMDSVSTYERNDLARVGGDEFVVLLEGIGQDTDALRVAERLRLSVAAPIIIDEQELHASLSIGVALAHPGYRLVEELLRDADAALYRAKAEGRACCRLFSDDLHAAAMVRWQTENELRRALVQRELFLQYQPIVSLVSGEIEHFEALVRWRHPVRGLVSPAEFIPIAEETGLIVPLGRWVLEESCRQIQQWQRLLPDGRAPSVAVNVASKQFVQPAFVEELMAIVAASGIAAECLHLEVTEGTTMDKRAIETCTRLRECGIKLHLDDFGTGYSSLSYLNRIPVNLLKIDRSFVCTMCEDPASASIVEVILALASALGLKVVAEGVETIGELELLRKMGCQLGQGYYWSKPVDPDRAFELLQARFLPAFRRKSLAGNLGAVTQPL